MKSGVKKSQLPPLIVELLKEYWSLFFLPPTPPLFFVAFFLVALLSVIHAGAPREICFNILKLNY